MNAATRLAVTGAEVAAGLQECEYRRLLRMPRGRPLSDALHERSRTARHWYALHGQPFAATRIVAVRAVDADTVRLETGTVLQSEALATRMLEGNAHSVLVVLASAGHAVGEEATRLWSGDRPDEAYFLDRLAAAITEHLLLRASAAACRDRAPWREQLLPHLSPGCRGWNLADQRGLMQVLAGDDDAAPSTADACGPVTLLATGALRPQHSLLAAFGVTRDATATLKAAASCRGCDLEPCDYRRVPSRRATARLEAAR